MKKCNECSATADADAAYCPQGHLFPAAPSSVAAPAPVSYHNMDSASTKVRAGWGFAWRWAALFLVLSFVTQIWANPYGGGFSELIGWSVLFGLISTGLMAAVASSSRPNASPDSAFRAAIAGQICGAVIFAVYHVVTSPPRSGDWWMGPACAAIFVAVWAMAKYTSK